MAVFKLKELQEALRRLAGDEDKYLVVEEEEDRIIIRTLDSVLEEAERNRAEGKTLTTEEVFRGLL